MTTTSAALLNGNEIRSVAQRIASFRRIHLPWPPQRDLEARMDLLLQIGRAAKGEPQEALLVLHPTFSGKTSCAKRFAARVNGMADAPERQRPVVIARLPANAGSRSLVVALLRGLDASFSHSAKEPVLWDVWRKARRRADVDLVVIDEVQRCSAAGFSRGVTDTFINLLEDGPPLVLMGTKRGETLLTANDEFNTRLDAPECLSAIRWYVPEEARLWTKLCSKLDRSMEAGGVVDATSGLGSPEIAEALCAAAVGRIGLLKRILQTALRIALTDGRGAVEHADLARAVDAWSIKNSFVKTNPFRAS